MKEGTDPSPKTSRAHIIKEIFKTLVGNQSFFRGDQ